MGGAASALALAGAVVMAAGAGAAHDEKQVTVLVVGGAGGDEASATLRRLEARLEALDADGAVVVFTGNYATGELPAEGGAGRAAIERQVLAHVEATRAFVARGGRVFYLAGDRDFGPGGAKAVRRLHDFLNEAYEARLGDADGDDHEIEVMPRPGCGDPTLLELNDKVGLMLVDSQWWARDWDTDPHANEGCEVKTRWAYNEEMLAILQKWRGRRLVIASHHPLASYGPFGGSFTAKDHLTPTPLLGSAWVLARQAGLVAQHQNHPLVRSFLDVMFDQTQRHGSFVFISGHDASLQYVHVEEQVQLISGASGKKATPTVHPRQGDFAASAPGWAELTLSGEGEGTASFFSGEGAAPLLFETPLPPIVMPPAEPVEQFAPVPEGPVLSGYSKVHVWKPGPVTKFFMGGFYSDAYALKLPWETLDLEKEGLTPHEIGGGLQTNALKTRDREGGEWTLRAVTKDASRALPWPMTHATVIARILEHGYTATQPEAALSMPILAEAVGVLHTSPRLVYVPDQPALGPYRGVVSNEVVLLERRAKVPKEGVLPESFAGPPPPRGKIRFRTTEETVADLRRDPVTNRLDQEAMLRTRLLDVFVGDWDRHQGQFSFVVGRQEDGTRKYTPIPKDRDQAFANYDGLGLLLGRLLVPPSRALQPFNGTYGDLEWMNFAGRRLDAPMLNRVTHARWLEIARQMQAALTDEVIDAAMATWHAEAYALDGGRIAAALKLRRDRLVDVADDYYRVFNRDLDVIGSARGDVFELWFEEGGEVRVQVRRAKPKDGENPAPFYDRVISPQDTRQLRLYGLEGDDALVVHGAAPTDIDVRFVGGEGKDTVAPAEPSPDRPVKARAIKVYDEEEGLTIDPAIDVRDGRSSLAQYNQYDEDENHDPDFGAFLPVFSINADDGALIGLQYALTTQAFKKHPFAARQVFGGSFATATLGAALEYRGLFPESLGEFDQHVDMTVRTPLYTRNFFGLTNEFIGVWPTSDYYRLRQGVYALRYGVSRRTNALRTRVGFQVQGEALDTQQTAGRYVAVSPDVTPDSVGLRYFAGARVFVEHNTFDEVLVPKRGVALQASALGRLDVVHGNQFSITYFAAAAVAIPIDRQERFVLLSRAQIEGIVGEHPFYFSPRLGGRDLRAYRYDQLAGDVAFAHTTDLRIDIFRIQNVLPGSLGVVLSVDHGRVWGPTITNDTYHVNVGGGLWWSIFDLVGVALTYHRGFDGGSRFMFTVGPLFPIVGLGLGPMSTAPLMGY